VKNILITILLVGLVLAGFTVFLAGGVWSNITSVKTKVDTKATGVDFPSS
jgi:hypothetical protein